MHGVEQRGVGADHGEEAHAGRCLEQPHVDARRQVVGEQRRVSPLRGRRQRQRCGDAPGQYGHQPLRPATQSERERSADQDPEREREYERGADDGDGLEVEAGVEEEEKQREVRAQQRDGSVTTPEPSRAIERGKLVMDPDRHSCTWDGQAVTLTVTEFLILQSLAQRPGIVKSRDALMDAAYDDQVYVDDRTIDSHIKRLRKKFKVVDDSFDAIETLYGVGYRFKEA